MTAEALICPRCRQKPSRAEPGDRCAHDGTVLVLARHLEARPNDPVLGRVLGDKYAIIGFVAEGGFGSVYRAVQEPVGRQVAVKCLAENQQRNEDLRQRFFREARVVARLSHPSTVVLHDYGEESDGRLFMVFELVEGLSLVDVLRQDAPLPPRRAAALMRGVLGALSEAHNLGLVHRDLKPSNIMVVRGSFGEEDVKVLDFGIAKVVSGEVHKDKLRTRQGLVLGTPHYMAPEQARGDDVDVRSDLYAVGVLIYEALTGRPPFDGQSDIAVLMAQIQNPVPTIPPELNVPPALASFVDKALKKKPAERFQTAEEMAAALLRAVDGLFGTMPPPAESTEPSPTTVMATTAKPSTERAAAPPVGAASSERPVPQRVGPPSNERPVPQRVGPPSNERPVPQPVPPASAERAAPKADQTSNELPALAMALEETPAVDPETGAPLPSGGEAPPTAAEPPLEPTETAADVPRPDDAEFGTDLTEQVDLPARPAPERKGPNSGQLQGERISVQLDALPAPRRRGALVAAAGAMILAGAGSAWWLSQRDTAGSSGTSDQTPVVVGVTIAPPDAAPPPDPSSDAPPPLPLEPYARAVELARRNEVEAAELAFLDALKATDDAGGRAEMAQRARNDAVMRDVIARPAVQTALADIDRLAPR